MFRQVKYVWNIAAVFGLCWDSLQTSSGVVSGWTFGSAVCEKKLGGKKNLQKLTEVSLLEARPGRPFRRLMGLLELSGALQGPLERTASCLGAAWGRLGALKVRWGSL